MVEEVFTDDERQYLLQLALQTVPNTAPDAMLLRIISRLTGVDTVLVARRAYASYGNR